MSNVAFITGITGQDGSYLADLLLSKGYEVHGMIRRSSEVNTKRLDEIYDNTKLRLHYGDMADGSSLFKLLARIEPHEVYNLAAQSHVRVSFDLPEYTADATGMGFVRLIESIKAAGLNPRIYQAGSSEMFGGTGLVDTSEKIDESTEFRPRSPYACAKVFAHHYGLNCREANEMFISNGILFNHESPRRGITFVTRKITRFVANVIKNPDTAGLLYLGNLDSKRDWGYAPEYVKAMWMILQQPIPDDYVIATGKTWSVKQFLTAAFDVAGIKDWGRFVRIDQKYFRPTEVDVLIGDASYARKKIKWSATVGMKELASIMVKADVDGENLQQVRKLWTS